MDDATPYPMDADDTADAAVASSDVHGRLDIVSDAICPWCFIGKRQFELAAPVLAGNGLRFAVNWLPFQLNPEMPREGVERRAYRAAKFGSTERSDELDRHVTAAAAQAGLTFRLDKLTRTPNTIDAHRLVWRAGEEGVQDAVMTAIFKAYFTEGTDIGSRGVLVDCAADAGMARAATAAFLDSDGLEADVRQTEQAARSAGVNGVPSFFLDGHGLFSGAIGADKMAEALGRAHAILARRR